MHVAPLPGEGSWEEFCAVGMQRKTGQRSRYSTGTAGVLGAFLKPMIGIHYLWWWVFLIVWLIGVGLTLRKLRRKDRVR